jgi:CRP-like cAMP-binding protein
MRRRSPHRFPDHDGSWGRSIPLAAPARSNAVRRAPGVVIERHLAKIQARAELSEAEEDAIRSAVSEYRDYAGDLTIIRAGELLHHSTLLLDGFMCRYKDLRDGQRQITELHVPGDFADLHSFTLKRLDHEIMTLTPCRVGIVPHENLRHITEQHPHLTRLYWFATNLDAAIHREWELSLGRRSALGKLASLFCELQIRLQIVGLATDTAYELPLTQTDLAECLGLTNVHVNRTLRQLREQGLIELQGRQITILDRPGLERVGDFDPGYLYLDC